MLSKAVKVLSLTLFSFSTLVASDLTIKESSLKLSFLNASIDKNGAAQTKNSDKKGLGIEYKVKTNRDLPLFIVGIDKYSDRTLLNARVALEQKYEKINGLTPFSVVSIGGVHSKWSSSPVLDKDSEDSTATSLLVAVEVGAFINKELFTSLSINLTDLQTNIDYLGEKASISEKGNIALSFGTTF